MTQKNSYTYKLSSDQQLVLYNIIKHGNYKLIYVEHAKIAGETNDCKITLYKTGKCLVQGKGAFDFVTFILEPMVTKEIQAGYEEILDPESFQPHMGIDESGKGDLFGPIVIASAYTDKKLIETMQKMGVKDSKNISSDKKAMEMGRDLRNLLGNRYSIVKIGPSAYNRLYTKMRNVNTLLAWGHARAIENLLDPIPSCPRAISDQFGNEKQVKQALMKKGRKIILVQKHKAESDIAVAAASVIARETFLRSLIQMKEKYDMDFPKGASATVENAGIELIKKYEPKILLETAKCHFKTVDKILNELNIKRSCLGDEGKAVSK